MWCRLVAGLNRVWRERDGGVLITFGLTLIPVVMAIGVAVDYGRALSVKQRVAGAIDAAALAVASSSTKMNAQAAQKRAQDFFDANYPAGTAGVSVEIKVTSANDTVTIDATGQVETSFMQIAGINSIDFSAHTQVTKKQRNIELVMVLDNTGSMSWNGKLAALQSAAKTLLDILFVGAENSANGEIKIGLVPFAAAVNIGSDKLNSGWIDTTAASTVAFEDFQAGVNPLTLYGQMKNTSWNGCVRARQAPYDTSDTPPSAATPATLWAPYLAPDEPDFSWYANRYLSDGKYGAGYFDYDARQRYAGKYNGWPSGWGGDGPDFNCQVPAVTPMTAIRGDIESGINLLTASGSTVVPAGLAWGWRLISPTPPFTEGTSYDDDKTIKAIVLLTDGENSVGGGVGNHNRSYYSAYGFAQSGHLGATNGSQAEATLNTKTSTLCTNIKAEGVLLYTVTFQLADGPIKDLMRNCATKTSMYFDSPSNEQLTKIFEEIAIGLSELRISE